MNEPTHSNPNSGSSGCACFLVGFAMGAGVVFIQTVMVGHGWFDAVCSAIIVGLIVGGLGGIFGKRVFDFLVELFSRFS